MSEWLAYGYASALLNFRVLWNNPSSCFAVDYLQFFAAALLTLVAFRLVLHLVAFWWLRRSFSPYRSGEDERLLRLYHATARKMGLRRIPPLCRFADCRPLAFVAGSLRPVIFLAPRLVRELGPNRIEALLSHELAHVKRRDNLRLWAWEVLLALIPAFVVQLFAARFIFSGSHSNLAIWSALAGYAVCRLLLWKPLNSLRERSCDDSTVEVIRDPLVLAESLIQTWRISRELPRFGRGTGLAFIQPFLSPGNDLEARVRRLVHYRRPRLRPWLRATFQLTALALLLLVSIFLLHVHMADPWEISAAIRDDGTTVLCVNRR